MGGYGYSAYVAFGGALEFDLGPALSPTFTSKDFTARLDGMTVTTSFATGAMNPLDVDLFNMPDGDEDGVDGGYRSPDEDDYVCT